MALGCLVVVAAAGLHHLAAVGDVVAADAGVVAAADIAPVDLLAAVRDAVACPYPVRARALRQTMADRRTTR